jgi:pimeloyl-ACP methyl ester carboxylesterase
LLGVFVVPKVKVDDIQVYYEVKGKGYPLLMITGLGGNLDLWDPRLVEGLAKNFKLVMFDNRGTGRTDMSDKVYTMKLLADDTMGLMNALEISKAHVLGLSMGGMIAQELVLNYPEKVSKMVLCSTRGGGLRSVQSSQKVPETPVDPSRMSPEEYRKALTTVCTEDFIKENPDLVELMAQKRLMHPTSKEAYMRQLNAIRKFDTSERFHQIKTPTLILHGRKDVLIHPENAAILAEAIPNAKLVYFEKSGHALAEETEKVINVTREFLL